MTWTSALHLKKWADTDAAKGLLPLLVRRLIRGIVPHDATVNFPAREQNHRHGFDGVVETSVTNQFIPNFRTAWEIGVNQTPKSKADDDFAKRCTGTTDDIQRNTTFVFVTPREWQNKDKWASEQKTNSLWKGVVAFDCNDLEHWLELCPHVDAWFAMELGNRPEGVIDLVSYWKSLQGIARYPLTENVFFAGRESTSKELTEWINGTPTSALLSSASAIDSLDFLAAYMNTMEDSTRPRILVVESLAAWHKMSIVQESLLLVATDRVELTPEDISTAVSRGHHVLVAGQRSSAHLTRHFDLPRLDCYLVQDALRESGFDDVAARSKAYSSCGSTAILKRLIGSHPSQNFPSWAREAYRDDVAPFVLLGGWEKSKHVPKVKLPFPTFEYSDAMIVEELLGVDEEELEKRIVRWSGEDPLFLRFRDSIVVTSREDAWHLLAPSLTPAALTSASQCIGEFSVLWRALDSIVRSQPISSNKLEAEASLREMWNQLVAISDRIVSSDNIIRSQWLFEHDVTIPGFDQVEDFDEYVAQLQILRTNAIQLISNESSWTGIRQLASLAHEAYVIGWTLAHEKLLTMSKSLLQELASSPYNHDRTLAGAYVSCSFQRDDAEFLQSTFPDTSSYELQASILSSLPAMIGTWRWIDEYVASEVANLYWKTTRFYMRDADVIQLPYVVEKFMAVARPWSAISVAWHVSRKSELTDEYLASVLERSLSIGSPIEQCDSSMAYAVRELFKRLQENKFQCQRLAQLEWDYLPILCNRNSTCSPKTLKQSLVEMPELYVQLIQQVYREASEVAPVEIVPAERQRAIQARRLIDEFDVIPGNSAIGIDAPLLTAWVNRVRDEASKSGHLTSADFRIGELLGKFRMTEPQHWPPEAICRVLEDSNSLQLFNGFRDSLSKGRGITSRYPTDGGKLERDEASRYRDSANYRQSSFSLVANCLRDLAKFYEEDAKREDAEAERAKLGR